MGNVETALGDVQALLFMAVGRIEDNTELTHRLDDQIRSRPRTNPAPVA
jgi:hypothetical protein